MMNAIRKALASIALLVLVPVEIVVNGVRTVVSMLVPQRNTGMLDAVDEFIDDTYGAEAETYPPKSFEQVVGSSMVAELEENRVKAAAIELLKKGCVPPALLDRSCGGDAENLLWLERLTREQLEIVASARPDILARHLNGVRSLSVPTLAEMRMIVDGQQTDDDQLSPTEWIRWITANQHPDRTYDEEALEKQARKLAAGGFTPARVLAATRAAAAGAAAG